MGADHRAKTPALGLAWANQIACRVALIKEAAWGDGEAGGTAEDRSKEISEHSKVLGHSQSVEWTPRRWRRWIKVVFAASTKPTEPGSRGLEIEVWAGGVKAVESSREDG